MNKMEAKRALEILKKEKNKNLSMIYTLENNLESVSHIRIVNNSIMIKKHTDTEWVMIHAENDEDLDLLMSELKPEDKSFNAVYTEIVDKIISKHPSELSWIETTYRFYLPDDVVLPKINTEDIVQLEEKDAEIVNNNWEYKDEDSINYVKEMILRNPSIGIKKDGKLVSWLSVHDDGALGFVYVLEEYRRLGYAKILTIHMCDILRKQKIIPFLYIEVENEKSQNLAKSLGFVSDRKVSWFYFNRLS